MIVSPTPPPYAGPEVASEILIKNLPRVLNDYIHLKSNIRKENWKKGKFDIDGLIKFFPLAAKFIKLAAAKDIEKVYLLLSSSKIGFIRDSIYILISLFFGKRIILHYRGGNFDGFYLKRNFFFKKYIRFILDRCSTVIVQAERLRKMFDGISGIKTVVLYNGLEVDTGIREKVFNNNATVLLFIGHVAFSKGFYELINVYKRIYRKYNLKLYFAGTFRFEGKKSKTQKAFLNGKTLDFYNKNSEKISILIKDFTENAEHYNAKYLGTISGDLKKSVFENSDLLVLPSYTEGFSLTVLESLSYGLPVIVSNVGALPEIVKENENGWIIEPGNEESLEGKIALAIRSKNEFARISRNNKDHFRNNFSIKSVSEKFEDILFNA